MAYQYNDSLFKLLWSAIGWILVLAMQALSVVVYLVFSVVIIAVHLLFYTFWLPIGFFLYSTKTIAIGKIWTLWFRGWTGTDNFDSSTAIDARILNKSIFVEVMYETFPQLLLQITNNQMMSTWDSICIFSTSVSLFMAINEFYRFNYWRCFRGVSYKDVPLKIDFGFGLKVGIPNSDGSSNDPMKNIPQSIRMKPTGNKYATNDGVHPSDINPTVV